MADSTSISLLERLRQPHQPEAWSRFVDLYTPLLFFWARRLGLQEQDAGDLVQDVLTTLVQELPGFTYDPRRSFRGWLRKVLRNKWLDHQRRQAIRPGRADESRLAEVANPNSLEEFIEKAHNQYLTRRALQLMQTEFKPTTWKACWAVVVGGKSGAAAAAELGMSEQAVYTAKWRVLRRLREELQGLLE
jgi:RNA polymerase sigma-70 factor (ECF subfamily)